MNKSKESQIIDATNAIADAITNDPQQNISPPYLKLIADCCEHIFDYLSLWDILAGYLIHANIQLDLLEFFLDVLKISIPFEQLVNFLKSLYERGFYKIAALQYKIMNVSQEHLNIVIFTH